MSDQEKIKLTEQELEELTKSYGKPLPKGYKEQVFERIRQKERLAELRKEPPEKDEPGMKP